MTTGRDMFIFFIGTITTVLGGVALGVFIITSVADFVKTVYRIDKNTRKKK
jgi:hypothetical protein